jgi:hypothetical protein
VKEATLKSEREGKSVFEVIGEDDNLRSIARMKVWKGFTAKSRSLHWKSSGKNPCHNCYLEKDGEEDQ